VQLTKAAGFGDRRVGFSRYQLFSSLGGVTKAEATDAWNSRSSDGWESRCPTENAWWDKTRKRWADAHFHLLDELVIYRRTKPYADTAHEGGDAVLSWFTWNEVVPSAVSRRLSQATRSRLLRGLKLAVAKRMYRFLDKSSIAAMSCDSTCRSSPASTLA